MARGWESKSVEQQQEEATAEKGGRAPLSREQIAEADRRRGLELSRNRILQQLGAASNPRHRQMLDAALAELDRKLRAKS